MWIWRQSCARRFCATAIFSARQSGPRPAMSASAWPSMFSLSVRCGKVSTIRGTVGTARERLTLAQSVQPEHAVDGAQFGRLDQLGMGDRHGEQRSIQFFLPEREEILQRRKFREQIVILPNIGLQQRGVIRHPIKNLRRRQPVTQRQFPEVLGNPYPRDHANLHCWSAYSEVAANREPPGGDALT